MLSMMVRGLPRSMTQPSLEQLFAVHGRVFDLQMSRDLFSGECKGFAQLKMEGHQARAAIADFFDCCRSAEWEAFDDFAGIPIRLTLAERRYARAARLVGHQDKSMQRLGRETHFSKALRARALAEFEGHLDEATVQRLIAEGRQLREEEVCALALETGK